MNSVEETAQRLREFFEAAVNKSTDPGFQPSTEPYSPREHLKAPILRVYEECVRLLAPGRWFASAVRRKCAT